VVLRVRRLKLVFCDQSAFAVRISAWLAAGEFTLLSRFGSEESQRLSASDFQKADFWPGVKSGLAHNFRAARHSGRIGPIPPKGGAHKQSSRSTNPSVRPLAFREKQVIRELLRSRKPNSVGQMRGI
jgi:hypothetical protein